MPAVELLKFMDMKLEEDEREAEKEKARVWLDFLVATFTQPSFEKDHKFEQAKREFIQSIQPKENKGPAKVYDWDFELMKRLQNQSGGRLSNGNDP
ncbi:hypothetical protein [Siminovitchia terrae]|uniref:hypothetical protein n=1 Tax=Siminovitchia terrae TaxID=1914933 RepID=UPI0028A868A5|nr:hypothetical protein [Siminovitchia terrae]